ncbi:ADP-ribosylation factor-like protein 15 [Corticium candelabrum]|uniref:ADP-ribosylation factor-like protein 15 n=1 Tax=Corticium candelabrum TaxID=121492 RepID=UPI002E254238|nr:ADP-ribosylation factor-like protein 15 [Corticium candelabrum]
MSYSSCQTCQLACAVLKILFSRCCRSLCVCLGNTTQRPEYSAICLGLEGAGKSTILATLTNEDVSVSSTAGFALKAVGLPSAILNVQELGDMR